MMNLTPEQAGKIFDLMEKMQADTAGLRKQIDGQGGGTGGHVGG